MTKRKRSLCFAVGLVIVLVILIALFFGWRASYRRPYRNIVKESGLDESLVYAVMKAESGFNEEAKSNAGAVGIMQLMPSTAEFVCEMEGLEFNIARLKEGEYNVRLGCLYLIYLLKRFPAEETALCAFNAGEGTVSEWLADSEYSRDGITLEKIPYGETRAYVKKVIKFRKIYEFFY